MQWRSQGVGGAPTHGKVWEQFFRGKEKNGGERKEQREEERREGKQKDKRRREKRGKDGRKRKRKSKGGKEEFNLKKEAYFLNLVTSIRIGFCPIFT